MAHMCLAPALILTAFDNWNTETGVALVLSVPLPSWPESLYPQHFTVPSEMTAHVVASPAAMSTALAMPFTATGVDDSAPVAPSPSCPYELSTQNRNVPLDRRAHECTMPVAT